VLGIINSQKVVFTYENEFRVKNQANPLYYDHNDFQIKYLLIDKYADVFTDYRLILQDKGKGFKDQSMFIEGFNLKYPEGKWGKINLRNRLEIGLNTSPTPTTWQLNEFPKYNSPWKFTKFKINPFIADESFWDAEHSFAFVKNRVYAGIDWIITPKIKGGTWYYYESVKNNPWVHSDVFVTQIRFEF
jgi:hypothetical protein